MRGGAARRQPEDKVNAPSWWSSQPVRAGSGAALENGVSVDLVGTTMTVGQPVCPAIPAVGAAAIAQQLSDALRHASNAVTPQKRSREK